MKIPPFLKKDGESLLYNQEGYLTYYVPEMFFEKKVAIVIGEVVKLMGMFNYTITDKNGKESPIKTFRFPTMFMCKPSEMKKVKNIKLGNSPEDNYRLLIFKNEAPVVVSVKVPQNVANAEDFYKIFNTGKIPTTIPYDQLHEYCVENIRLNGADYGLNMQIFGVYVGEMCRSSKNPKVLFRHTDMKDMTDYQCINIKQIPKMVSPFTSITSENWDEAVVNAVTNKNTKYSPLEKLFTL